MSTTNGTVKGQRLTDKQKWILQNFLVNRREQIISEKQTCEAIATTLEKPIGVRANKNNIEHAMRVVGMLDEYRRHVYGSSPASGIALAHARTSAIAAAVKKIAQEIGVDVSTELGVYFQ